MNTTVDVPGVLRAARHLVFSLKEVRRRAAQLAAQLDAVEKGYFSPAEDEQAQALLVSYTQLRAALLDLIGDLRTDVPPDHPQRSICFIAGYAAALALVEAARFLRAEVEHRPVVRDKLNQRIPEFGIPGGTYDAVQRSLTGAGNAWGLYWADRYFTAHQDQLHQICSTYAAEDLWDYVAQHRQAVDVHPARFAKALGLTRLSQALAALQRNTVMRAMYGVQKLSGELMAGVFVRRGHRPRLPRRIVRQLAELVRPGDVLVVRKEYAITNYFLPGYWPHAALYLGTPGELTDRGVRQDPTVGARWELLERAAGDSGRCVLESMKDGVLLRSWMSPLASDSVVVLRPQLDEEAITQAMQRVMVHVGKDYDFDFDFARSDRLVCTEVVYRAYDGLGQMRLPLTRRAGRMTLSGYDLCCLGRDGQCFDVVAAYVRRKSRRLLAGHPARQVVSQLLPD